MTVVTIVKFDNAIATARVVREQFARQISVQTMQHTLNLLNLVASIRKEC